MCNLIIGSSKIGVVILNYGIPDDSISLADALREKDKNVLIVIVDNFSSQDNLNRLKEFVCGRDSSFLLVESLVNAGYGRGNNLGLSKLFDELSCEFALVLNPDVTLEHDFNLDRIKSLSVNQEILFTGVVNQHGAKLSCFNFKPWCFSSSPTSFVQKSVLKPQYISGCCFGMSKLMWYRSRGFSESYFLYFEELDFIYRYKSNVGVFPMIQVLNNIHITHREGGTTGASPNKAKSSAYVDYWSSKSRLKFAKSHLPKYVINAICYNILLAGLMIYHRRFLNAKNYSIEWSGNVNKSRQKKLAYLAASVFREAYPWFGWYVCGVHWKTYPKYALSCSTGRSSQSVSSYRSSA